MNNRSKLDKTDNPMVPIITSKLIQGKPLGKISKEMKERYNYNFSEQSLVRFKKRDSHKSFEYLEEVLPDHTRDELILLFDAQLMALREKQVDYIMGKSNMYPYMELEALIRISDLIKVFKS